MERVTTNGTLQMYKSNLLKSTRTLNNAMTKLMTKRSFNSYAANPAGATRAFKIHSSLNATRAQAANNQSLINKFETAYGALDNVLGDIADKMGQIPALEGLNGTNDSNLHDLAAVLKNGAEAIVQSMNSQYDSKFLFAGADSANPPFDIQTEDGRSYITYRGVRIDDPVSLTEAYKDAAGIPITKADGTPMSNQEVLDMWNKETQYIDIGLGFKYDKNGELITSTAYDAAISGIGVLGYGVDDNGIPKNPVSAMLQLADLFNSYNDETHSWAQSDDYEKACQLTDAVKTTKDEAIQKWAEISAKTKFLKSNETQLNTKFETLNTERSTIEDIDQADVIMELVYANTCYLAALQVGSNVIPQSLMDYMR